ncbi:hypothetical protein HDU76_009663 [Blyttiomyces sp. JEL0837]|nr:hypothetical protein HDU76_009663 [Blyttiomyces sp. JEL0837]
MSDYDFAGGGLKLKGLSKPGGITKKKKKKAEFTSGSAADVKEVVDEVKATSSHSTGRQLTAAEKRFEEVRKKRMEEKAAKVATKSHKERVQDFNSYLDKLTEHYDIPKVGPG